MKRTFTVILVILTVLCLSSCDTVMTVVNEIDLPFVHIDKNGAGVYEYTDFTDDEKSLFNEYIGAIIPFAPCDKYSFEGYYYLDDYEHGINYYTEGNTADEFIAYLDMFSDYTLAKSYVDEFGDEWYRYIKDDVVVEISYYRLFFIKYIDVFVYSSLSTDLEGGDHIASENAVITNDGKGLPKSKEGVYNVDLTKAENVKNVTDQGDYVGGCPTTGSPAVLVVPVEFSDRTAASRGYTTDTIKNAFLKGGKTDYYSVYDYYFTSSYGQLDLDITVLDFWFMPEQRSKYYYRATDEIDGELTEIGDMLVLDEALDYLEDIMDLSKFDSDGNGTIDAVVLINTLDVSDEDFYWAYRYWNYYTDDNGECYEYDGVYAYDFVWASYQFLHEKRDEEGFSYFDDPAMNTYTYIHEFGHILGVDDYYDTEYIDDPMSGYDIMDMALGDHNAYTKFNLGWITKSRLVVTDSSVTLTLRDFSTNGDTIIIANNWDDKLGAYQEYYVLSYYKNTGLNPSGEGYFDTDGVVVYHVNASLYCDTSSGEEVYNVYNNNTSASTKYGTVNNLIEYVLSDNDTYTYAKGDVLPDTYLDSGEMLGYTFTVVSVSEDNVTITFTAK